MNGYVVLTILGVLGALFMCLLPEETETLEEKLARANRLYK